METFLVLIVSTTGTNENPGGLTLVLVLFTLPDLGALLFSVLSA